MKKIFFTLSFILGTLFFTAGNTFALSFMEGTRFLDAKTKEECEVLGGHFTDWYGEIYCTKSGLYTGFEYLIKYEPNCKRATDGCNTVMIINGQLGAMTQMYCEDTYGPEGKESWECLDTKLEQETLGFMSENDKNYYKTLQTQIDSKTQEKIGGVLDTYGNKILEKNLWNVSSSVKTLEKIIKAFETSIYDLSMKTPADAGMSVSDTKKYQILNYAKFELQIMMHRWMRNAGIN